jgi:hypothetical protein
VNERDPLVALRLRDVDAAWKIDTDDELRRFHMSAEPSDDRAPHPRRRGIANVTLLGLAVVCLLVALVLTTRGTTAPTISEASRQPGVQPAPGIATGTGGQIAANPGSSLDAIDGAGANDIWAVGETHGKSGTNHSLVLHWDGTGWTTTTAPDVGGLIAVDAISPNDAWALGYTGLLHWNGAEWTTQALPRGNYVALSASGPGDIWVAGTRNGPFIGANSRGLSSVAAHFDGSHWTVMRPPNPGTRDDYLTGIVALSPTDVWAGGYLVDLGKGSAEASSLTMHWDGQGWSVVAAPNPSRSLNVIWGMGSDGAGGVWALGDYRASDRHLRALVFRWNGQSWVVVDVEGTSTWSAQAVGGTPSGPVWVVGSPATSSLAIANCNETTCDTVVPPTEFDVTASSIFAAAPDDAWIVGVSRGQRSTPLIEHWDGSHWIEADVPLVTGT